VVPAPASPTPRPARREAQRRRLPATRTALTHKFKVGNHEGYITAGMYEDGTLGEVFFNDIGKEGSTLNGMVNACAMAISVALQYGVPLQTIAAKYTHMRFDPSGDTDNPRMPKAKSIPDYAARWLASIWCQPDAQQALGIHPDPAIQPELPLHVIPTAGNGANTEKAV
jgi:ribonucleoside-diphosphate reductase alpha chain